MIMKQYKQQIRKLKKIKKLMADLSQDAQKLGLDKKHGITKSLRPIVGAIAEMEAQLAKSIEREDYGADR